MKTERKLAIKAKEKWYFTGKPCVKGHLSKRNTVDGSCSQCRYENMKEERKIIREYLKGAANHG